MVTIYFVRPQIKLGVCSFLHIWTNQGVTRVGATKMLVSDVELSCMPDGLTAFSV